MAGNGWFWARMRVAPAHECWEWFGAVQSAGYGHFKREGRWHKAHRFAYELVHGAIPRGYFVDHLCRNRKCCNPSHLEAVTPKENTARGLSPTAVRSKRGTCDKGHPYVRRWNATKQSWMQQCQVCKNEREKARRARKREHA